MKKYLLLHIPALVCFAQTAFAQLQLSSPLIRKEVQMPIPDKQVIPASTRIIPAHIRDIKKPFVVSVNNIRELITKARAQCPSLKSPAPTLMLKAERANNLTANLQWETKYAFKASGFHIERSLADTFHFATVNFAWATGGGGLKKNYHLPDYNDFDGVSFYRIKLLNHDAAYLYSNIALVKGYDVAPFKIYPNPASDRIWIEITAQLNGNAALVLYDATGRIMRQQTLNCIKDLLTLKSIDVSKLAGGVYQVKILMPDKTFLAGKFIKE